MTVPETLLQRSWRRAGSEIGARGDGEALGLRLADSYREPQRRYHTLQHLAEGLAHLDPMRRLATAPAEVELALWFHDAVYDVRGDDNEARSAAWAADELRAAGAAAGAAERVHALVMATRHAALPATADEALLVDIDPSSAPRRNASRSTKRRFAPSTPGSTTPSSAAGGAKS